MTLDLTEFIAYLLVPWAIGAYILYTQDGLAKQELSTKEKLMSTSHLLWILLLLAFVLPALIWQGSESEATRAVSYLALTTLSRVGETLLHLLRYVLPFSAYPLIIFWLKVLVNYRADTEESGNNKTKTRNRQQQRVQAQLITFAIKVMVRVVCTNAVDVFD